MVAFSRSQFARKHESAGGSPGAFITVGGDRRFQFWPEGEQKKAKL
jgi:hypothetical protein